MRYSVFATLIIIAHLGFGQSFDLSKKAPASVHLKNSGKIEGELAFSSDWHSIYFVQGRNIKHIVPSEVKYVQLNGPSDSQVFYPLIKEGESKPSFFEVLAEGEMKLLYQPSAEGDIFFISKSGTAIPLYTKSLFGVFGKSKKSMKSYAFSHNLNESSLEDLIQIFTYYNETAAAD